jgi:hypothetical protein
MYPGCAIFFVIIAMIQNFIADFAQRTNATMSRRIPWRAMRMMNDEGNDID